MKEIKNVLFVHRDDCSLNPLFEAILRQAVLSDSVLSTAGLEVDSVDIEFPGADVIEWALPLPEVQSTLDSLGFQSYSYRSKNVKIHSHLIRWADLILVPDLGTEDLLCLFSHDAWNKTIRILEFCGKKWEDYVFFSAGKAESTDDYLSMAATFKMLLPDMIDRIKDSYASRLLAKGRVWGNKQDKTITTLVGNASVVRCGGDLLNFKTGNILVADRLGVVLQKDISEDLAMSVIKKLVKFPEFCNDKVAQIEGMFEEFKTSITASKLKVETTIHSENMPVSQCQPKKKAITPKAEKFFPDGTTAVALVARNAKAVVCSRGVGWVVLNVPYLYNCVGATEQIRDNQLIVVDSTRGEVYDAMGLKSG